jgi:hypothetical protein
MYRRLLLIILLAPALLACATVSNTLSPEQVAGFRLTAVTVGFAPDAQIWWPDAEPAGSKVPPAHDSDSAANTTGGQAHLRSIITSKLKDAMRQHLAEGLNGTRPVRVDVTVKQVHISPVIQRVVLAGSHFMIADATLVDAKTGETLATRPGLAGLMGAGAGMLGVVIDQAFRDEPIDGVVKSYAAMYGAWLLRRT